MVQKGGATKSRKPPNAAAGPRNRSLTLREEATGKIQPKSGFRNSKSFLKLEHLQKLAVWAGREASIPSLAAFFGRQFAAAGEALGVPPDPSLFLCQRCETILWPGFNCTIRIEKTRGVKRRRKHKRPNVLMQNSVVYKCHFCSYQNRKRGTPKGYMKKICPPKAKPLVKVEPNQSMLRDFTTSEKGANSSNGIAGKDDMDLPVVLSGYTSITSTPAPLSVGSGTTLLDAKKRKRSRSGSKKPEESDRDSVLPAVEGSANTSSKRKRKSWTTLKEIAASNERESSRNIANLTIPFLL
uniref:Uncharacterized protein n=1 Tax=Rhizophora mucronata TaxID=61149 RepID=A0A2P2Q330_RHIMU